MQPKLPNLFSSDMTYGPVPTGGSNISVLGLSVQKEPLGIIVAKPMLSAAIRTMRLSLWMAITSNDVKSISSWRA